MEIYENNNLSLKVTGTDTDRSATYDFLLGLMIHSNRWCILHRFPDKQRFQVESRKISRPRLSNIPAEGFPWNIVTAVALRKLVS